MSEHNNESESHMTRETLEQAAQRRRRSDEQRAISTETDDLVRAARLNLITGDQARARLRVLRPEWFPEEK